MRILLSIFISAYAFSLVAQINNLEYESYQITDQGSVVLSMDLSPEGDELVVSTYQGKILFFDPETFAPTRDFNIPGFQNGAHISYSFDGRYLVLKKIQTADRNLNKDHKQRIIVLDRYTGNKVLDHNDVYDLALSPDDLHYAVMDKGHLQVRTIADGKLISEVRDERLQSSIAFGPDGKVVYASRGFDKSDLKKDSRFHKDRKGLKSFSKYQQTVVGYDVLSGEQRFISPDNMDEVYDMRCSRRGDCLLIYAKQDLRVNAAVSTHFVLQMSLENGMILREQFNSKLPDPDYKENLQMDLIGITTTEDLDRSESVMLYDRTTNEIIARFDIDARFLEGVFRGKMLDGGAGFAFSADGRYLLVGIGNMLYRWEIQRTN